MLYLAGKVLLHSYLQPDFLSLTSQAEESPNSTKDKELNEDWSYDYDTALTVFRGVVEVAIWLAC